MKEKYMITFDENNFNSISDFILWSIINKEIIVEDDFEIEGNVDKEKIYSLISFLKYYLKVRKLCDKKLSYYNGTLRKYGTNECLKEAIDEFVRMNDSGKFLRGTLAALGYNSKCDDDGYLDLSLALEVFQTSILIHDDIIDKASVRRGKDTIPVSYIKKNEDVENKFFDDKRKDYANGMSLCLGDLGFYLAEEVIVNSYKDSDKLSSILSYYHDMAIKTCLGEMIDIELPFKEEFYGSGDNLEEKILEIYKLKTAWYSVIGPYCLGMTLAGFDKKDIECMEDVLLNVGMAFQIKDDILGIYGDDKYIGKSTNSDIEEYKQTVLYAYVMNSSYKEELVKNYGKKDLSIDDVSKVKEIFDKSGAYEYSNNLMNQLFESSLDKIRDISFIKDEFKDILIGFIVYLENRTK